MNLNPASLSLWDFFLTKTKNNVILCTHTIFLFWSNFMKKIGTITSVELAKLCGVSQGTVDRAINNRAGISPKTKEKILKIAREYGYIKNMNASFLASGKTNLLGLVVFNFNNEFFTQLTAAVEQKASELGYSLLISVSNSDVNKEKETIERLLSFGVDGVILCPVGFGAEYEELISRYQKPIITIANKTGDTIQFVGANDKAIIEQVTENAFLKGYEETVFYAPPLRFLGATNIYAQKMRAEGYKKAINKLGEKEYIFTYEDDVISFLKNHNKKTAVITASDIYALRIISRLKKEGMKVPNDVGVCGFDNISSLSLFEKKLTTVNYPITEIGETAVEYIINSINGNQTTIPDLKCNVILGETF